MRVCFKRTGERRYAVLVAVPGRPLQAMDPAPGFDAHIPHDLVHYLVEAVLGMRRGVFGRAAEGGGSFVHAGEADASPRQRARAQRKLRRREDALRRADAEEAGDMARSERLAAVCDVLFRRRHGQRPSPTHTAPSERLSTEDAVAVERVLSRLDDVAAAWSRLPIGGAIWFSWPSATPDHERPGLLPPLTRPIVRLPE